MGVESHHMSWSVPGFVHKDLWAALPGVCPGVKRRPVFPVPQNTGEERNLEM